MIKTSRYSYQFLGLSRLLIKLTKEVPVPLILSFIPKDLLTTSKMQVQNDRVPNLFKTGGLDPQPI